MTLMRFEMFSCLSACNNISEARAQGYKFFYVLNSAQTKFYPAHKC